MGEVAVVEVEEEAEVVVVREWASPDSGAFYLVKLLSGPAWEGKHHTCSKDVKPLDEAEGWCMSSRQGTWVGLGNMVDWPDYLHNQGVKQETDPVG